EGIIVQGLFAIAIPNNTSPNPSGLDAIINRTPTPTPSTSLGDDFLRIGEKLKIPLHLLQNPFFFHLSSGPVPFWSISGLFSLSKYPVRDSFTTWSTVFFTRSGVGSSPKAGSEI